MRMPGAERAVIDSAKIRDYLLSPSHPVGRFKAVFFASLGYTAWIVLAGEDFPRFVTAFPGDSR